MVLMIRPVVGAAMSALGKRPECGEADVRCHHAIVRTCDNGVLEQMGA
jgi:hypothetical protein